MDVCHNNTNKKLRYAKLQTCFSKESESVRVYAILLSIDRASRLINETRWLRRGVLIVYRMHATLHTFGARTVLLAPLRFSLALCQQSFSFPPQLHRLKESKGTCIVGTPRKTGSDGAVKKT